MSNPYFRFKQFTVWHDKCAMRVNTDGVLLGAWTTVDNPQLILDIGTGTGLLALMMAQRSNATIHAIDIEENAYKQAFSNVANSPWPERVHLGHADFCDYYKTCPHKYDLIISNPPYFHNSLKNPDRTKVLARHSDSLSVQSLLKGVSVLLTDDGIFSVILPAENNHFENEAFLNGLKCLRKTIVRSFPESSALRQMLEFKKAEKEKTCLLDEMIVFQTPGKYSPIYLELTKNFYLNF